MPTYVALLRAINLGARRQFPKDAVRAAVEAAGGSEVETYLNTGNVRLRTTLRSRAQVEKVLEAGFLADRGFEVPTIVFTPGELLGVARYAASLADTLGPSGRHYVELLRDEPSPEVIAAVEAGSGGGRRAHVDGRAIHFLVDDGYAGAALLRKGVDRQLGVTTNRAATVVAELASRWAR